MKVTIIKNKIKKHSFQRCIHLGSIFLLMACISSALLNIDVISTYGDKIPNLDVDRDDIDVTGKDVCPEDNGNDNVITCYAEVIVGTDHADTIFVQEDPTTSVVHRVYAESSDDFVSGSDEEDNIFGQAGNDILEGNIGNDRIDGGSGNDAITGGIGSDYIAGDKGNDRLFGGTEDDTFLGGDGADSFNCGEDVDTVLDYNPAQGDTINQDCEIVNTVH